MMMLGLYDPNAAPTYNPSTIKVTANVATQPQYTCSDGSMTLDPTLASCPAPWWQQWYVIGPVLGIIGFVIYKHKHKIAPTALSGYRRSRRR